MLGKNILKLNKKFNIMADNNKKEANWPGILMVVATIITTLAGGSYTKTKQN